MEPRVGDSGGVCPHQFIEDSKIIFWLFVILFGVGYGQGMDLDSGQTFKFKKTTGREGIGFWYSGGAAWASAKRRCVSTA